MKYLSLIARSEQANRARKLHLTNQNAQWWGSSDVILINCRALRRFVLFFFPFLFLFFFFLSFFFSDRIETRVLHLYLESVSNSRQNMCLSFCLCLQHINFILLILRCGRMNQTDSLRGYTFLRLVVGDGKICTKLVLKMQALNGEHINTVHCKKIGKKFKENLQELHT